MGYSYFNPLTGETKPYGSDAEAQAANAAVYHHFGHSYVPIYHQDGARTTEAPQPAPVNLVDPNDPVWQASQGTISATQPTLMDSLTGAIHRGLSGMGISDQSAQRTADQTGDLLGATPVGAVSDALRGAGAAYHNFMHGRPDEGLGAAAGASLAALGAVPGEGEAADVAENAAGDAIRAWHGSPHDFDQFDMSKIGTGEGAQAYGHGMYFSSEPKVAEAYKNDVVWKGPDGMPFDYQGLAKKVAEQVGAKPDFALSLVRHAYQVNSGEKPLEEAAKHLGYADLGWRDTDADTRLNAIQQYNDGLPKSKLYEVNINAHPDHFLDWDAPLSEQHPQVQQSLAESARIHEGLTDKADLVSLNPDRIQYDPDRTGRQAWQDLHSTYGPGTASRELSAGGIPGIKYLDQGSRGAGNGTHNYVVFDPAHIEILRKLGLLGLLGAGGMAAMPQSNPQAGT